MIDSLSCPKCQKNISTDCFNISTGVGKCSLCNCLFDGTDIGLKISDNKALHVKAKPTIFSASGVKVKKDFNQVTIERSWFIASLSLFMAFFALFWNAVSWGIMAKPIYNLVAHGTYEHTLLIPHPYIGLIVGYIALALNLNKTTVFADRNKLSVKIGPIPWKGNLELSAKQIRAISLEEYVGHKSNNVPQYAYKINAHLETGRPVPVIKGIYDKEQALLIEQTLESHLGLKDNPTQDKLIRKFG